MNDRDEVEDIIIEMSQKVASLVADEINTEKFLEKNPNFESVPCGLDGAQFLSLSPFKNNTDGFFAAKFQKRW